MRNGAVDAEKPANKTKEAQARADDPPSGAADATASKAGQARFEPFSRFRRGRADARGDGSRDHRGAQIARAAARGDRHPAAGHRLPRRRGAIHPLEQEIRRDLQGQLRPVQAGRAACRYDPRRCRARRLSRRHRPRGGMDCRAARQARSTDRPARADADRRPRHPDRGTQDRGRRRHRAARRHHRAEAARGVVPPAVRQQPGADDRLRAGGRAHPVGQRGRGRALRLQPRRVREAHHPQPAGVRGRAALGRRSHQRRAGGADLETCQGRRLADRSCDLFARAAP